MKMTWKKALKQWPEANFLQSPEWGKVNELMGHKVILEDFGGTGWCLMIIKDAKRGRYLEIPGGPLIDWADLNTVRQAFEIIRSLAKKEKCVFVRVRPQLEAVKKNLGLMADLGLKKAPMHLHAEHTVMIDLEKNEEELLKNMRRQTRYEVRRADKLNILVETSNDEAIFQEFHQVQSETAARQNFVPPNLKMLQAERAGFGKNATIYRAYIEVEDELNPGKTKKDPIAYGLILAAGDEAEYFEAASTSLNYKLPGAYALLWRAMRDLKKRGIKRFNLWGIAPKGVKNHRYAGVTTFKTGFGGEVVEFVPAEDLILRKGRYLINWLIESIRRKKRHL